MTMPYLSLPLLHSSIMPASSIGPKITVGPFVGRYFFSIFLLDLYEQCSDHSILKICNSVRVGSLPSNLTINLASEAFKASAFFLINPFRVLSDIELTGMVSMLTSPIFIVIYRIKVINKVYDLSEA